MLYTMFVVRHQSDNDEGNHEYIYIQIEIRKIMIIIRLAIRLLFVLLKLTSIITFAVRSIATQALSQSTVLRKNR